MSTMDVLIEGREEARFALEGSTMTTEQKNRIRKIAKMTNQELKEYGADLEEWRFELKQEAERRRRHD